MSHQIFTYMPYHSIAILVSWNCNLYLLVGMQQLLIFLSGELFHTSTGIKVYPSRVFVLEKNGKTKEKFILFIHLIRDTWKYPYLWNYLSMKTLNLVYTPNVGVNLQVYPTKFTGFSAQPSPTHFTPNSVSKEYFYLLIIVYQSIYY